MPAKCCNPFKDIKNKKHSAKLRFVSKKLIENCVDLKEDDKICDTCRIKLEKVIEEQKNQSEQSFNFDSEEFSDEEEESEDDFTENSEAYSPANKILKRNKQLPIKRKNCNSNSYQDRKSKESRQSSNCETAEETENTLHIDSKILQACKEKFINLKNFSDKIEMLTVAAAAGLSVQQTIIFFPNCTKYMALKARMLYQKHGISSRPQPKSGKKLPENKIQQVKEFYTSDMNSRVMPGVRDVKTVNENGEKIQFQKRPLYSTISELYIKFKEKYPEIKIGIAKFAELRPPYCMFAGSPGSHNICVCLYHQNPHLMAAGSHIDQLTKDSVRFPHLKSYKECMQQIVCDTSDAKCMLGECGRCPGEEKLKNILFDVFQDNAIEEIKFKKWEFVDRCNLNTVVMDTPQFIDEFCSAIQNLLVHSFICNAQSNYFEEFKRLLKEGEVVIILDYSEKHPLDYQNAIQHQHFDKTLVSVHVAVAYYKEGSEMKHLNHKAISESTKHDATSVHLILSRLVPELKEKVKNLKSIHYWSDGAPSQYKNKSNFLNLTYHESDFGVPATWDFHVTGHGKGKKFFCM